MAVAIVLASGQIYSLPRDFILTSLPGSLLAQALADDPEATEIIIPNPVVTPHVMQVLVDYSQGIEPTEHDTNLIPADDYLNSPLLLAFADPLYDQIPNRFNILETENREVWVEAIRRNHDSIVSYFLAKGWIPDNTDF